MLYKARFTGRLIGAIGIFYACVDKVEADDEEQARLKLYEKWEHIQNLVLTEIKRP